MFTLRLWGTCVESRGLFIVKLCGAVSKTGEALWATARAELDKMGYVNQHGLSRKVNPFISFSPRGILY
jgi:hypothetical protein